MKLAQALKNSPTLFDLALLLAIFIGARAIAFSNIQLDSHHFFGTSLYFQVLSEHFWEYLAYTHTKPPLNTIIHKLMFELFNNWPLGQPLFWLTVLADFGAVLFLYLSSHLLKIHRAILLPILSVYGVALINWELWRQGTHYDHLNIFIISWWSYSLVRYTIRKSLGSQLHLGLVTALFVLNYTIAIYILPLGIIALLFSHLFKLRQQIGVWSFYLAVAFSISIKNKIEVDTFSTSTLGGAAMTQFVFSQDPMPYQLNNMYSVAQKAGFPDWWLKCFDKAKYNPLYGVAGPAYGACLYDSSGRSDADIKLEMAQQINDKKISEYLLYDAEILKTKPWLYVGAVPEGSSRFSVAYQKYGIKLWLHYLWDQPKSMMKNMLSTFGHYSFNGSLFLATPNYEAELRDGPQWVYNFGWLLVPVFMTSFAVAMFMVLRVLYILFFRQKWNDAVSMVAISTVFISATVLLSILNCCENDRYFVNFTPISILLATYAISQYRSIQIPVVARK